MTSQRQDIKQRHTEDVPNSALSVIVSNVMIVRKL